MKDFKLADYRTDVEKLLVYIPWLESKRGVKVSRIYDDNGLANSSVAFPVYDSTLLNFVNEASKTGLMDENYVYAFSGRGLSTTDDEIRAISEAGLTDAGFLCGVLSKYVMGGMRRGTVWNTAVEEGIFLEVLLRMKTLLEIWDKPLA